MRFKFLLTAVITLCLSSTAFGQQAKLEGNVYEIVDDKEVPVSGVKVISPDGQSQETDSKGHFVINFPDSVRPGKATRIEVNRPKWVIRDPFLGEYPTQNATNVALLKVIIVPKGSLLALEPKQLSKVIARWADERVKLRGQVKELGQQLDEYTFLREYAEKYGVTLEQFKDAADRWAKIKKSDDKEERALQEYWLENYDGAVALAREAALGADEDLERANKERLEAGRKVIRRFRLEGNIRVAEYKFREALSAYNEIEKRFLAKKLAKDDLPEEWAELKLLLGNTKQAVGERVAGQEGQLLLLESVKEYRQAFSIYTREQFPQQWAGTQNNLGNALGLQGERAEGGEGMKLLGEAVQAYHQALQVYTREQAPQQWAVAQNNLGNVLSLQGERAEGSEGMKLLGEAVQAYRAVLKVWTREQSPRLWAGAQHNLGNALSLQGERAESSEGVKLLGEATQAFREALQVRTPEKLSRDWADTQNILGNTLRLQGERAQGAERVRLLNEAVQAYRAALQVYTREQLPQDWAGTQNILGNTLSLQGERERGTEGVKLLSEAVQAYREALKVYTREEFPQQWARTQDNLGSALSLQGERAEGSEGMKLLNEAVLTLRAALQVRTPEKLSRDWAGTQNNLGNTLRLQGERAQGAERMRLLGEAVQAYRAALQVFTREQLKQDWARTQNNLGDALQVQGERAEGAEGARLLDEAVQAYREALKVRTREEFPQQWAGTQNNLGVALMLQGRRTTGAEGVRLLDEAVQAYREALKVYTREEFPQQWTMAQYNLARVFLQLRNWPDAAASYTNVLSFYPDNKEAYSRASLLYQNLLFNFEKAFALNQQWLARHPDVISDQAEFAEKNFTTGRFDECQQRISPLLARPQMSASTMSALRAIEIANLLALGQPKQIPAKLEALLAEVSLQSSEFKVEWFFDGVRHFIDQNEKVSAYREWLGNLFNALAGKDRETILSSLRKVVGSFQ